MPQFGRIDSGFADSGDLKVVYRVSPNRKKINDNCRDTQETEIQASGIPPTNDAESAIVSSLAPGNYTAIVRGVGDTTGVGLVEAYELN